MGLIIILGIYILAAAYIIRLLMRIPKKPMHKRIVLYLCLLPAILMPIVVANPIALVFLIGLCAYISLAAFITRQLMRIPKGARNKHIVAYLSAFTVILIPIWDVPLIDWKFNQLCETEAGIHVYEKAVLGPEYWKEDGTLNFPPDRDLGDVIPKEFEVVHDFGGDWSPITRIRKTRMQIRRRKDQKIIGEGIYINHGPGWVQRMMLGQGGTEVCPSLAIRHRSIAEAIFKRQSN